MSPYSVSLARIFFCLLLLSSDSVLPVLAQGSPQAGNWRFGGQFLQKQQSDPAVPGLAQSTGLSELTQPGMPLTPPAPGTVSLPGGITPEAFSQIMANMIPAGTVLTGTLEATVASEKNKRGDVFAVILEDGLNKDGRELIPPGSRILGAVVDAFPAAGQRNGLPGRLTVNLQTLVFPDGRNMRFHGVIDHNPAHDQEKEPEVKFAGFGGSDYGKSVKGMFGSFASGIGSVHSRRMRGKDLRLKEGTPLAIKVNRRLDLKDLSAPVGNAPGLVPGQMDGSGGWTPQNGRSNFGGMPPSQVSSSGVPGLVNSEPPGSMYRQFPAPPLVAPPQGFEPAQQGFQAAQQGFPPQQRLQPPQQGFPSAQQIFQLPQQGAAQGFQSGNTPGLASESGYSGYSGQVAQQPPQGSYANQANQMSNGGAGFGEDPNKIFDTPLNSYSQNSAPAPTSGDEPF